MPFIPRQKIKIGVATNVCSPQEHVDDDGRVVREFVDDSKPLPPLANFSLGNMLKAGVDIRKVGTKIVGTPLDEVRPQFEFEEIPQDSTPNPEPME